MDNHHQRQPRTREYRRRKANLSKYSSLPGLKLVAAQQQLFHCNRCGFISTLLPLCLWCTWAFNDSRHDLQPSKIPTRRVSSPALLLMHVEARPNQRDQRNSTKQAFTHHNHHTSTAVPSYPPSVAQDANTSQQGLNTRDIRKAALSSSSSTLLDAGSGHEMSLHLETSEAFNSLDNDNPRRKNIASSSSAHVGSAQPLYHPQYSTMRSNSDHVYPRARVIANDHPDVDISHCLNVTTATSATVIHKAEPSTCSTETHPPALNNDSASALAQAQAPREEVADISTDLNEDTSRSDNTLCETSLSKKSSCDRLLNPPANFPGESFIPPHNLPSCSSSVDRSSSESMAVTTKISMRTLKATRRGFIVDLDGQNANVHPYDDNDSNHSTDDENNVFTPSNSIDLKSSLPVRSLSPRPQSGGHLRTLRRKKHLRVDVVQPYTEDAEVSDPITISLPLHAEPAVAHLSSSKTNPHGVSLPRDRPVSAISAKHSDLAPLVIAPMSTIEEPINTPTPSLPIDNVQPASRSPPTSSPVKLGHPSRPYYSAIRKGMSPPSSRPTSMSGPIPSSNVRPKSYNPPSGYQANATLPNPNVSRHMSISGGFAPGPSTGYSAFSVQDDDGISDDNIPASPPAIAPARLSLSLNPGRVKRSSYEQERPKRDKRKSGRASMSAAPTHGIGFSMSGETELRMALAAASGSVKPSYNYQSARPSAEMERSPISPVSPSSAITSGAGSPPSAWANLEGVPAGPRNSFSKRVKKLRKGLKDMLGSTPTSPC